MNRKLILVMIVIAGSVAVFGQASERKVQRYTATGCRPSPSLNSRAISLPEPVYPPKAARMPRTQGPISVQVLIDEEGNVVSATAVAGHSLLRAAAVQAAKGAKFPPTFLSGQPVKISGILVYIFPAPPRKKLATATSGSII